MLVRGDRRIRVGLAGPGKAFGYEGLIDGRPSPVTAITRERALLLVLPRDPFEQLFNGEDAVSRVFLDVIQRDLVATLRQTFRPLAREAFARGCALRPVAPDRQTNNELRRCSDASLVISASSGRDVEALCRVQDAREEIDVADAVEEHVRLPEDPVHCEVDFGLLHERLVPGCPPSAPSTPRARVRST